MSAYTVLEQLHEVGATLHKAGTFERESLEALFRHASAKPIRHSAETGSGVSTILLSHISPSHTVFALDAGNGSIENVTASPLFRSQDVRFVYGPTQVTLPYYRFFERLDFVLIDGPHGWPFPDLEYFYFYPHIASGGTLVIDDIQIPTIGRMKDILEADAMWSLVEVVKNTAFFIRTDAPALDPTWDGWWKQGYNKSALWY
jgi:hypothetical protein